jgi:hypothetical protein
LFAPKRGEQVLHFQCGFWRSTSHLRHIRQALEDNYFSFIYFMADEPVSRILYGTALAGLFRDDHSSSPGLATGVQRPTRGFILPHGLRRTKGSSSSRTNSVSRASSPLLFGLAPRGVCLACGITAEAVGSYPTFSPLPAMRTMRRHPEGFPPSYHRDTIRWRYILCGTIRDA